MILFIEMLIAFHSTQYQATGQHFLYYYQDLLKKLLLYPYQIPEQYCC